MAVHIHRDAKVWTGAYDFTGLMNAVALDYAAELVDSTTLGDTTRERLGGLKTVDLAIEGYFDGAYLDPQLFQQIGLSGWPISIAPEAAADGDRAFLFRAIAGAYAPGGELGGMLKFSLKAQASAGPLVKGNILHPATARTASGNGTGRQLGAVGATQRIHAALHVLALSGAAPTLDVKLQSDNGSGFASPADQITFAQKTAAGYEWASAAGAITDDWWRAIWTIGGGSPSFTFVLVAGIA
jgi:hypothetical protein